MRLKDWVRLTGSIGFINLVTIAVGLAFQVGVARFFGAGPTMDAYVVALGLPDLVGSVFLLATFPTLTAPLFADVRHRSGEAEAWRMVSQLITLLTLGGLLLSALVSVVAPPLVMALAPGLQGDKFATTVWLTRLLFPTVILAMLRSSLMALLNIQGRFALPYLVILVTKAAELAMLLLWGPHQVIELLVALVWFDGIVTTIVFWLLLPGRHRLRLSLGWTPAFRHALASAAMITLIGVLGQISDYAYRWFGSFLRDGAISLYYYASKFMPLSLGFLSMLIGRTLLPTLSALSAGKDWPGLKAEVERGFRVAVFLLVPLLAALWVGRDAMLSILLYRGAFSEADLEIASRLVLLLLPATAACALTSLFQVVLYAAQRLRQAATVTGTAVTLEIVLMAWLVPRFDVLGIAVAMAVSRLAVFALAVRLAESQTTSFSLWPTVPWTGRLVAAAAACVIVIRGLAAWLEVSPWRSPLFFMTIEAGVFAGLYPLGLYLLGVREVRDAVALVVGKGRAFARSA